MPAFLKHPEHPLSWSAILRVCTAIIVILLVKEIYVVLLLLLVAAMLASALYPFVKILSKTIPLSLASVLVMLLFITPVLLTGVIMVPRIYAQLPFLTETVNGIIEGSVNMPEPFKSFNIDVSQYTENLGSHILRSTSLVGTFLANAITIIFLALYLLIDSRRIKELLLTFLPLSEKVRIEILIKDLAKINGHYIRGNLFISFLCGLSVYLGLKVIGIPFAGALALFAAVLDLLPLVGAFVGAVPAVLLAFAISPTHGVLVLCLFLMYQQIENAIIAPNVYDKALDISPALSFVAVIIGSALLGIFGAFLALPIAASIPTLVKYMRGIQKEPV